MVGVSTGLEPYFAFKFFRSGRLGKFMEVNAPVVDKYLELHPEYSHDNLPEIFVSAMDLSPEEHANVQCIIQRWVDSSISKLLMLLKGLPSKKLKTLFQLYKGGAKEWNCLC